MMKQRAAGVYARRRMRNAGRICYTIWQRQLILKYAAATRHNALLVLPDASLTVDDRRRYLLLAARH